MKSRLAAPLKPDVDLVSLDSMRTHILYERGDKSEQAQRDG